MYHHNFGGRKMDLEIIHWIADNLIQGIAIQYQLNYFIFEKKSKIYLNQQMYIRLSTLWVLLKAVIQKWITLNHAWLHDWMMYHNFLRIP